VTFTPLSTTRTINVDIIEDSQDEFDETAIVTLGSPTNAKIGLISTHTLTIEDEDPVPYISFEQSESSAQEGVSVPAIAVSLFNQSGVNINSGRTVVAQVYLSGTAQIGSDFTFNPVEVRIPKNVSTVLVPIAPVNDHVVESNETATLTMELYPSNAHMGAIRIHNLLITDNDFRLHLYKQPSNGGTLSVSPAGAADTINLPTPAPDIAKIYPKDTNVTLIATGATGYALKEWTGDVVQELTAPQVVNQKTIAITGHKTATAEFERYYNLTLTTIPANSGTIELTPDRTEFFAGQHVSFEAEFDPTQWRFQSWSGGVVPDPNNPSEGSLTVGESDIAVTATFIEQCLLTTSTVGNGQVLITPPPGDTGPYFDVGAALTLTANPDPGWTFTGWTTNLPGNPPPTNPFTFSIADNTNFVANFQQLIPLTVNVLPSGQGLVTVQGTIPGSPVYQISDENTQLSLVPGNYTLHALGGPTHMFRKFSVSNVNFYNHIHVLNLSAATTINVHHSRVIIVTPSALPPGSGWVDISPESYGINGDVYLEHSQEFPSYVSLFPLPSTGYKFVQWSDGFIGTPPRVEPVDDFINGKAIAIFDFKTPNADFSATPQIVVSGQNVQFTDLSDGNATEIIAWEWDFGDESALSNLQNPTHAYETPGTYDVSLKVTNEDSFFDTEEKQTYITVLSTLAAHWPFDAQDEDEAVDVGPDGLNLTLSNATQVTSGILGSALEIASGSGATAEYDVQGSTSPFDLTDQATMMVWFKLAGSGANQTILSKRDPGDPNSGYEIVVNPTGYPNSVMLRYGDGNTFEEAVSIPSTFELGEWHHLGVVFDAGTVSFYINAEPLGPSIPGLLEHFEPNIANFKVGAGESNANHFVGMLDELIIQRIALGAADIFEEFSKVVHTLSIEADPESGTVNVITLPSNGGYTHGQTVTFTANPLNGYTFESWAGPNAAEISPVPGESLTWSIVMNSDKAITANFAQNPVIDFTTTSDGLTLTFNGACSTHLSEDLTWSWQFGDGTSGSGQNTSHTYATEAAVSVTLTVTVTGTAIQSSVQKIIEFEGPPKAAIQVEYIEPQTAPYRIRLTDVSTPGRNQSVQTRTWTVPGNSPPGNTQVNVEFAEPGEKTVTLRVVQGDGQEDTASVTIRIHEPPNAAFAVSPSGTKYEDHYITFTDTSDPGEGEISEWRWTFGNGTTTFGKGPHTQVYAQAGTYTASLTIRTQYGSNTKTAEIQIQSTASLTAPDVRVDSITGVSIGQQFQTGDAIGLSASVSNDGTTAFPIGRKDALYISLNETLDANDLKLGTTTATQSLSTGTSQTVGLAAIPLTDIAPGRYYLIVNTNDDRLFEINETDNTESVAITVVDPEMSHE